MRRASRDLTLCADLSSACGRVKNAAKANRNPHWRKPSGLLHARKPGNRRFKGGIQVRLKRQLLVTSLDRRSPVRNEGAQEIRHMSLPYLLTSESVSDGHPDKLADRISDTVLDRSLTLDRDAMLAGDQGLMFG
jgi:hypothetical protein